MHNFYDGIDYRYSSSDSDKSKAIEIISSILGVRPTLEGLEYSFNLYAGGTGVDDRLAIRLRDESTSWPAISQKLRLRLPTDAIASPDWSESFEWLIRGDNQSDGIAADVRKFIADNKHTFQDYPEVSTTVAFSDESDVNSWCAIWRMDGWVNYLSFDQG